MSDENEQEHQGFFALRLAENGEGWTQFTFSNNLEELKKWGRSDTDHKGESEGSVNTEQAAPSDDSKPHETEILSALMDRLLDSALALSELT